MSYEEYERVKALNWSALKNMADSPLMYQWREEHPRPSTPQLELGIATHMAILEPERFAAGYVTKPDGMSFATREGKAWKAAAEASGQSVVSFDDGSVISRCAAAVTTHQDASRILAGTRREESVTWSIDGVLCKARLDAVASDRVVDLKTTRDLGRFERDCADFLYHGQMAWYLDGAIAAGACSADAEAYIVAVETSEPYDCACFRLPPEVITIGRELHRRLFDLWMACRDADLWPGRHPALCDLTLPKWAMGGW